MQINTNNITRIARHDAAEAALAALTTRADAADQRVAALEQQLADLRVALDAALAVRV